MKIFRMHRAVRDPSNYLGAMDAGGRWNSIGTPMLYTAEHLSLACVEVLVYLDKSDLPRDYVWSRAEVSDELGEIGFNDLSHVSACQLAGDRWVRDSGQLAIRAPSVVIPEEFNVLLNPTHADYNSAQWTIPRPFRFDPRLFVAEPRIL
jgi:RES domain-containing protein